MRKFESENERVAQIAFQLNSLTSSSREATLPLWGGCCERKRATPRGYFLAEKQPIFFMPIPNCQKLPPPSIKEGGVKIGKLIPYEKLAPLGVCGTII